MYNVLTEGIYYDHFSCIETILWVVDTNHERGSEMKRVGMVRVGLYLSDAQTKKLKTISRQKGLTVSEIIRRMIDEGFERLEEGNGSDHRRRPLRKGLR